MLAILETVRIYSKLSSLKQMVILNVSYVENGIAINVSSLIKDTVVNNGKQKLMIQPLIKN